MKGKIFNAQEVQALLNGSKVMFREVVKPQPFGGKASYQGLNILGSHLFDITDDYEGVLIEGNEEKDFTRKCPYQVGQKIFCKERFKVRRDGIYYGETPFREGYLKVSPWSPAQHMKQEHSRITLLIKEIGVERLASISEEDCWKEGLEELADYQDQVKVCQMAKQLGECIEDARPHFATWWNATHKKPEEKFEANPWVWVISCEVVK